MTMTTLIDHSKASDHKLNQQHSGSLLDRTQLFNKALYTTVKKLLTLAEKNFVASRGLDKLYELISNLNSCLIFSSRKSNQLETTYWGIRLISA